MHWAMPDSWSKMECHREWCKWCKWSGMESSYCMWSHNFNRCIHGDHLGHFLQGCQISIISFDKYCSKCLFSILLVQPWRSVIENDANDSKWSDMESSYCMWSHNFNRCIHGDTLGHFLQGCQISIISFNKYCTKCLLVQPWRSDTTSWK